MEPGGEVSIFSSSSRVGAIAMKSLYFPKAKKTLIARSAFGVGRLRGASVWPGQSAGTWQAAFCAAGLAGSWRSTAVRRSTSGRQGHTPGARTPSTPDTWSLQPAIPPSTLYRFGDNLYFTFDTLIWRGVSCRDPTGK